MLDGFPDRDCWPGVWSIIHPGLKLQLSFRLNDIRFGLQFELLGNRWADR
jgi:hypothetical protein